MGEICFCPKQNASLISQRQGAMSIGAKGINNLGGLVAFRFCLGLVEAGKYPHEW